MNDRQKERMFRTHIACKIADIEDNHCKSCEFVSTMNKFKLHCMDCKHGQELRRYGDLLSDKSKMQRAKKPTQKKKQEAEKMTKPLKVKEDYPEINGLTREKYVMLKDEGTPDGDILSAYKITQAKLTSTKEKWGLLGYTGNTKKGPRKPTTNLGALESEKIAKGKTVPVTSYNPNYEKLEQEYETLKTEHEKLVDRNVGAAEEFLKMNSELEQAKETIQDLQVQLSSKDNYIDILQDQVNELEQLESIKEKYLAIVAALKLHLPEVGES